MDAPGTVRVTPMYVRGYSDIGGVYKSGYPWMVRSDMRGYSSGYPWMLQALSE